MSFTDTLWIVLFVSGCAVGFGHCLGMCGPIVVSLSLNLKGKGIIIPHTLYNLGRVTTYGILGGVMGATGSFTAVTSKIAAFQKGTMIIAGVLIMVMGVAMSGWLPVGKIFQDYYNPNSAITRGFRALTKKRSVWTYFPLGLLLGLLPCGPVYTALITAVRAGMESSTLSSGALTGAGLMVAFGLGTVPALFLLANLTSVSQLRSRDVIYKVGAVLMIGVGVYYVVKGIRY